MEHAVKAVELRLCDGPSSDMARGQGHDYAGTSHREGETDSEFGLFDLAFTPIVASYHISKTDHIAFSFTFWAPTGAYNKNRLANLSLNNWTFIPDVAYTKIFPKPTSK